MGIPSHVALASHAMYVLKRVKIFFLQIQGQQWLDRGHYLFI
jgi:hypothetical protein